MKNDNEKLKQERDELLNMLVKIAYAKWSWEEVYDLMTKYGYEDKEENNY